MRRNLILFFALFLMFLTGTSIAQVTASGSGLAASYPDLGSAITALNAATITEPVVITLSGNETAPAGGYVITATGTSTNTITIQGSSSTITASAAHTAGSKVDAIFKVVGSDYVTIQNFTMQENAANTVTTVASNTMTEFGVALFLATATDGAQNNTIKNNTISLGSTYQNAIAIFSSSSFSSTNTALAATATTGTNSNNKVYGNTITSVAFGVYFICEPVTATITESGNDIGGVEASTGNTITYGVNTAADAAWTRFSSSSAGITMRNGAGYTIRYNTVNTVGTFTVASTAIAASVSTAPAGVTFTNTISNNSITMYNTGTTALTGIDFGSGISTGTIAASNNTIVLEQTPSASSSAIVAAVKAGYASAAKTVSSNTITIKQNAGTYTGAIYYLDVTGTATTVTVHNNILNTTGSAIRSTGTLYGANQLATVNLYSFKNNTINIERVGTSGTVYGTFTSSTPSELADSISENSITFTGLAGSTAVTAIASLGGASATGTSKSFFNNTISITGANSGTTMGINIGYSYGSANYNTITISNAATTFYGINASATGAGAYTLTRNTVSLTSSATSPTAAVAIYGGATGPFQIYNNTFSAINFTAVITGSPVVSGIQVAAGTNSNIYDNTVTNITVGAAGSTGNPTIDGILVSAGTSTNVYRNKIYGITSNSAGTTNVINGIRLSGGTTNTVYNNLIGGLTAPGSASTDAIRGISVTSTTTSTTHNVYFNTVNISASSTGANFGASGVYHATSTTATTSKLNLMNNIIVNNATPAGTGLAVAFRRSSGLANTLANYASTSNNNLFYAGTPGASNLIYSDGTSTAQTMAAYKAGVFTSGTVAPRDGASFSENAAFVSTTGSANDFLHINTTTPTQIESGGVTISGITTDYDNETRSLTTPDLGADEFVGTGLDFNAPTISYTALNNTALTTARTLTASVVDYSGVPTSGAGLPVLYWKINSTGTYAAATGSFVSGNSYQFTYGAGVATNDTVYYYIVAQDNAGTPNVGSYPSVGASGFTVNPPAASTPTTAPSSYVIIGSISGVINVGAGQTYTSLTADTTGLFYAINRKAVTGNLTINIVSDLTENGANALNQWSEDGVGNYTMTIQPDAAVMRTISGTYAGGLIRLNGADRVSIDGRYSGAGSYFTIQNTATTGTVAAIHVGSLGTGLGANNITVRNCVIKANFITSGSNAVSVGGTTVGSAGDDNDNISVINNTISKAYNAVYVNASATGVLDGVTITGNSIGSVTATDYVMNRGIYLGFSRNAVITGNTIFNMMQTGAVTIAGIDLAAADSNALVSQNKIYNLSSTSTSGYGAYGINVAGSTSNNNRLINNLIYNVYTANYSSSSTTWNAFGIRITGALNTKVYYNTVSMSGTVSTGTSAGMSSALVILENTVTGSDIRNNIFANNTAFNIANSKAYSVWVPTGTTFGDINYNDYYASGTYGVLGYFGADVTTLGAWQTATTKDANSLSGNPQFFSATSDPHINTAAVSPVDNVATPIAGITTDYDGDARHATTPDIGADEFTYVVPSVDPPAALTATTTGGTSVRLNFTPNGATNNVLVIYNASGTFGTPGFAPPAVGDTIAGGTVVYYGTTSPQNHTGLTGNTTYYYKAYSYNGSEYSFGVTANATTATAVPYTQDFNASTSLPSGWSGTMNVTAAHGTSSSNGLNRNMYSSTTTANALTPRFGGITSGMALEFDYRIVNYTGYPATGTTFAAGNSIQVQVSTDNTNFTTIHTIDNSNHTTSNSFAHKQIMLNSYVDSLIYVRYLLTWASGDYYVDVDNFFIGTASLSDPQTLSASATGTTEVSVTFTPNASENNVVLVYNTSGVFTTPVTPPSSVGDTLAGGIMLYNGTTSPYAHTGLTAGTAYYYKAFSYNGSAYSTGLTANAATTYNIPYAQSFDSTTFPPPGWTLTNAGSGNSWSRGTTTTYSGAGVMKYIYSTTAAANAWAFTPSIRLVAGTTYRITFYQRVETATYTEKLKVTIGTTATPAGQTTTLWNNAALTNTAYTFRYADYICSSTGNYYFAFNAYSDADMYNIYVDQVEVKEIPPVDLSLNAFTQFNGMKNNSDYNVNIAKSKDDHDRLVTATFDGTGSTSFATNVNNTRVLTGSDAIQLPKSLNNVTVKGYVENVGRDDAAYTLNWTLGGVSQTAYNGPVVAATKVDTASLTISPTERGTFYATATITATGDDNSGNNTANEHVRIYPNSFTRKTYDRGDNTVDTYVGWNSTTTRMKAGVRFTTTSDIKLAGVDFIYRTDAVVSGDVSIQVRAAGADTTAPGAVLYTQEYNISPNYISETGDYFTFAFAEDAPTIAAGSDYWITIKAPMGITYPGGTQAVSSGRSYYEGSTDTTAWTALVLSTVNYSWMMRSINVALPTLTVKALYEGLMNGAGTQVADTVVVSLHNATAPYALVEQKSVVFNTTGNASAIFTSAVEGTQYYIVLNHRNSIETWSATAQSFSSSALSYDFTTAATQAYGDNQKLVGAVYTVFSGDVNQDDFVDFTDLSLIDNDSYNFVGGYVTTDLNGDQFVDFSDLALCDNNSYNFVGAIIPGAKKFDSGKSLRIKKNTQTTQNLDK